MTDTGDIDKPAEYITGEKPLILVIDDEKITSRTMAMALEAVGYQTVEADSGEAGLKTALERHPQLIFLDFQLPGIDGMEVLKQLRADPWGKVASVIMVTNVYDVDLVNSIMALNVQDYVLKIDINLDEMVKLADKYAPLPASAQAAQTPSPQPGPGA